MIHINILTQFGPPMYVPTTDAQIYAYIRTNQQNSCDTKTQKVKIEKPYNFMFQQCIATTIVV